MTTPATHVRFGFLGAGGIARTALAPAVHAADGALLQAAAARDPLRARALGPAGPAYGDYASLVADPDVEIVYIALSNDLHTPWTLAAIEAGKHVLCEKPLGLDLAETRRMVDAARAAGVLLVEAYWYRWHPRTRRLLDLVAGGHLGRVERIDAEFSFAGDWSGPGAANYRLDPAKGGGGIADVGCYTVSLVHAVLDAAGRGGPLEVYDVQATPGPTGVDVDARAGLVLSGERVADVRCGIAVHDRQAIVVRGTRGEVAFGAPGVAERDDEAFTSRDRPSALTVTLDGREPVVERFEPVDPYRLMVEQVSRAVRGGEEPLVDGGHSLDVATTLAAWGTAVR